MLTAVPSLVGSGLCNAGPGSGIVPFGVSCSNVPCQVALTMPITLTTGQVYGNNSPDQIQLTWQNGTSFTSSNTCFVLTGSNQCDKPTSTSTGHLAVGLQIFTGAAGGTAPAAPYGAGYASFTPVDPALAAPSDPAQARGTLNLALRVEVKATTGSDMCSPTGSITVAGTSITPTTIPSN